MSTSNKHTFANIFKIKYIDRRKQIKIMESVVYTLYTSQNQS